MIAFEAKSVRKEYDTLVALKDVNLNVKEGELVALVGHNGSGKSTLLRLAAGLLELTSGELLIDGSPAGSLDARAAFSFLADEPVLYDDLSVDEHCEYVAMLHSSPPEWPEKAVGIVQELGLAERVGDLPSKFSRGLRQKTAILLALIRPFTVLAVDEPFVGLDPSGQRAMLELLTGAAEAGAAVIVSTHQMEFLDRATRVVILRDGAIVRDGKVSREEVLKNLG